MRKTASLLLVAIPTLTHAHASASDGAFVGGLLHPVSGVDHLLAMLSVGVLSVQFKPRDIWVLPVLFVVFMIIGGTAGWIEPGSIPAELGIICSLILLGGVIAGEPRRIPGGEIALYFAVATFGIFHGYAHGAEAPQAADPLAYTLGFVVATSCIHVAGVVMGEVTNRAIILKSVLRVAGAAMIVWGAKLALEQQPLSI